MYGAKAYLQENVYDRLSRTSISDAESIGDDRSAMDESLGRSNVMDMSEFLATLQGHTGMNSSFQSNVSSVSQGQGQGRRRPSSAGSVRSVEPSFDLQTSLKSGRPLSASRAPASNGKRGRSTPTTKPTPEEEQQLRAQFSRSKFYLRQQADKMKKEKKKTVSM